MTKAKSQSLICSWVKFLSTHASSLERNPATGEFRLTRSICIGHIALIIFRLSDHTFLARSPHKCMYRCLGEVRKFEDGKEHYWWTSKTTEQMPCIDETGHTTTLDESASLKVAPNQFGNGSISSETSVGTISALRHQHQLNTHSLICSPTSLGCHRDRSLGFIPNRSKHTCSNRN